WKETSFLILKVQTLASGDGDHDSASDGTASPVSGCDSTSVSPQQWAITKATVALAKAGSSVSADAPPPRPSFKWPPRLGSCASRRLAGKLAAARDSPSIALL